jgi:hypothetical protein
MFAPNCEMFARNRGMFARNREMFAQNGCSSLAGWIILNEPRSKRSPVHRAGLPALSGTAVACRIDGSDVGRGPEEIIPTNTH